MKFKWDTVQLSDDTYRAAGVSVNGRQVVQEANFLRAATASLFARKNRSIQLSFSVQRTFGTIRACEEFVLNHHNTLVDSGTLTARVGLNTESPYDVLLQNAVLEAVSFPRYTGVAAEVQYQFRAPKVSGIVYSPPPDADMRTGTLSINNGVSTQTFTGLAFPSAPLRVLAIVVKPLNGAQIFATVVDGTLTTDGFRVDFDATIPAAGYKLNYLAVL